MYSVVMAEVEGREGGEEEVEESKREEEGTGG